MNGVCDPDGNCLKCGNWYQCCSCEADATRPQPKTVFLFPDGSLAAIDQFGQQITPLQRLPVWKLFCKYAQSLGYKFEDCTFHIPRVGEFVVTNGVATSVVTNGVATSEPTGQPPLGGCRQYGVGRPPLYDCRRDP